MAKKILIVCGEPSGDLNASNLVKSLKKLNPELLFFGVGGNLLREAGVEVLVDIKELAVLGLFDVLKKLPRFFSLKKAILKKIAAEKPACVILVDFSGFNLRLAKAINKKLPVIYYTSPQVWASRPGRVKTIKNYVDRMLVFFKFEEEFYRQRAIRADFIGHPLLDIVRPTLEKNIFLKELGLWENKITLALLPGSRKQEVENILPLMLKTSAIIAQNKPGLQVLIAKSTQVDWEVYQRLSDKQGLSPSEYSQGHLKGTVPKRISLNLKIIEGKTYDCLNAADFCLVASGTATLETAITGRPFVVVYKMGLLNYLLYRPQVKLPFIGMVNIVAGRKIIPEFIQFQAKAERIAEEILESLNNPAKIEQIKNDLAQVKASLGESGAGLRAAHLILDYLKYNR